MNKETIFSEALARQSPQQRREFLAAACRGDKQLQAEIESLLSAYNDAGSFLNKTPDELLATVGRGMDGSGMDHNELDNAVDSDSRQDDAWKSLLQPSENPDSLGTLGGYEVLEAIGRGGMGVVLRARDPKLNRIVAIKLLAPELAINPMAVRRFLREAQAAAAVSQDHVVTIHAIDEQSNPPVIVMEYIRGQSLQQKIDSVGVLDVKSILRIGMQTAAGLSAAHRQGLVHRDVKPANILLENGVERVKLTDFGLARAVDDIAMTRTGTITGTPQYMSPEQARGDRVDHRTDLFSLGCVLYAMCTGRPAFRADSAMAVLHRILNDTPRPISAINEDVPDWLAEIVFKLLEKNPDDRFGSAEEVEDLLGRHLAHLQQPDSVPQPERIRVSSETQTNSTLDDQQPEATRADYQLLTKYSAVLTFVVVFIAFGVFARALAPLEMFLLTAAFVGAMIFGGRHIRRRRLAGDTHFPFRSPVANQPESKQATNRAEITEAVREDLTFVTRLFPWVIMAFLFSTFGTAMLADQTQLSAIKIAFGFFGITSLIVLPIVIMAAFRLNHFLFFNGLRQNRGPWLATLLAVIPWNPLLVLLLPWTIRAYKIVRRPDVVAILDSPKDERAPNAPSSFQRFVNVSGWVWVLSSLAIGAFLVMLVVATYRATMHFEREAASAPDAVQELMPFRPSEFFNEFTLIAKSPISNSEKLFYPHIAGKPESMTGVRSDKARFEQWKVSSTVEGTSNSLRNLLETFQAKILDQANTSEVRIVDSSTSTGPNREITGLSIEYSKENARGKITVNMAGFSDNDLHGREAIACKLVFEITEWELVAPEVNAESPIRSF